jgi:hypothetical protein
LGDFGRLSGLPDGLFPNPKYPYGYILEALESKMLVIFVALWNVLEPLVMFNGQVGIFCGRFGNILPVLVCCTKKNLATLVAFGKIYLQKRLVTLLHQKSQPSTMHSCLQSAGHKVFFSIVKSFAFSESPHFFEDDLLLLIFVALRSVLPFGIHAFIVLNSNLTLGVVQESVVPCCFCYM